ncbi:hypothetical protein ACFX1Q_000204 [Malus domestica]
MSKRLEYLPTHRAPFVVNIYPFLSLSRSFGFPKEFAFFDGGGKTVRDNGDPYNNVFDANYDTLLWTLKKAGVPNLDIVIGEVGWPTDGHDYGSKKSAKKFYDGLLKNCYDGKPKFPHGPLRPRVRTSDAQRRRGIEILAEAVVCVLNSDVRNLSRALAEFNYACTRADCTSLGGKRSCDLEMHDRISYAFNEFYQNGDQDVRKCNFRGMGKKVTRDPSQGDCLFRIQIDLLFVAGWRHALGCASTSLFFIIAFFTLF